MAKGVKGSTPPEGQKPVKTSLTILPATMDKVRHIVFHEKLQISTVVDVALSEYIERYEQDHGPIPVKQ